MEKKIKQTEIELRSEEFQEIVSQSPRWLIRSGIFLVFGLLVLLLAGSYFYKYPDVIESKIVVCLKETILQNDSLSAKGPQNVSEKKSDIRGKIILSLKDVRKVKPGQKVNIRFDDFPSMEYGFIHGTVSNISMAPVNSSYIIEVELPQDRTTNYGTQLNLSPEMKGSAEIITEEVRLIQRLFIPLKSLIKQRIPTKE